MHSLEGLLHAIVVTRIVALENVMVRETFNLYYNAMLQLIATVYFTTDIATYCIEEFVSFS